MGELDGKVAIVTGAGRLRGIGRAAALHLAELGADLVVTGTGRNPDPYPDDEKAVGWRDIESTADEVREQGRRALTLIVDVTNQDQVQAMVAGALEEFGRVDILINNAVIRGCGDDRIIGRVFRFGLSDGAGKEGERTAQRDDQDCQRAPLRYHPRDSHLSSTSAGVFGPRTSGLIRKTERQFQ